MILPSLVLGLASSGFLISSISSMEPDLDPFLLDLLEAFLLLTIDYALDVPITFSISLFPSFNGHGSLVISIYFIL